jgi:potassium/hydrogen antiporter
VKKNLSDVITPLVFFSAIIIIGFLGNQVFRATRISDVLILMLFGLAVGPIFGFVDESTILLFRELGPLFSVIALLILMFEGGLQLQFQSFVKAFGKTILVTMVVFLINLFGTGFFMHFFFGWDLLWGFLLGAIIGGTSSAIIISILSRMQESEEIKTILTLESALTDALVVIFGLAIIEIISANEFSFQVVFSQVIAAFSIAAVIGAIFAVIWMKVLQFLHREKEIEYMLSLAMLFLLYVIVEYANGNGAMSALIFGLVLGNGLEITRFLKIDRFKLDKNMRVLGTEIGFFVRTFFFVYIGMIFELSAVTLELVLALLGITAIIVVARTAGAKILCFVKKELKENEWTYVSLMNRGIASAVLASMVIGLPKLVSTPHYSLAMPLVQLVFLVILFTNISNTLVMVSKKEPKKTIVEEAIEKNVLQDMDISKSETQNFEKQE